jgi:hypothetical protein
MKEEERREFLNSDIYWAIPRQAIGSNRTGPPTQEEKYAWLEYQYKDVKYQLERYWELYGDLPPGDYACEGRLYTLGKVTIGGAVGLLVLVYIYFKFFSI